MLYHLRFKLMIFTPNVRYAVLFVVLAAVTCKNLISRHLTQESDSLVEVFTRYEVYLTQNFTNETACHPYGDRKLQS